MRIATPDLVTNSYFPALAAEELGVFREEGLDAHVQLLPSLEAVNALRGGAGDFVAGGAHTTLLAFPQGKGGKLGRKLVPGTPWLAVGPGGGPRGAGQSTFAALATTEALIAREPERVAAAVRAIVRTQRMLRKEPARASEVGRRRFPPAAAEIIAAIVERDLPFYEPVISQAAVETMNGFAQAIGLLATPVRYDDVVATRLSPLWSQGTRELTPPR